MSDAQFYTLLAIGIVVVIATIVVMVVLVVRVARTQRYLRSVGASGRWVFPAALFYTLFPIDLLPDPVFFDDIGVLGAALLYLTRLASRYRSGQMLPQHPVYPVPPRAPQRQR